MLFILGADWGGWWVIATFSTMRFAPARISTPVIPPPSFLNTATRSQSSTYVYLTAGGMFLLLSTDEARMYRQDLASPGGTLEHIHGDGSCDWRPDSGDDARSAPLVENASGACSTNGTLVIANDDATTIWINPYPETHAYQLQWDADAAWLRSHG